jgi:hypothetical protein
MKKINFWQDTVIGPERDERKWFASDGISTYFGDTKEEAAAHFGVPVGLSATQKAASTMGRKGGKSKSDAKTSAARENGKRGGRPKRVYEAVGDWSSVDLTEGQAGWIYWSHTRITGERTSVRILIPYGTGGYHRGQDMEAMHNDHVTVGDYLCHVAEDAPESGCKILQSGTLVE